MVVADTANDEPPGAQYIQDFNQAGEKYGVSPWLLYEIARRESGFQNDAKSPKGAIGIMQFEPATAAGIGVNPYNPRSSIFGAARLIAGYEKQFGTQTLALAAYNAGSGNVIKYGGVPPFQETQEYVAAINQNTARDIKRAGKKAPVDAAGNVEISPAFFGLHWRDLLEIPHPSGPGLVHSAIGAVAGDVERPVVEGAIVLAAVGLIGVGVYVAVTGHRPHPVQTAQQIGQDAGQAAAAVALA